MILKLSDQSITTRTNLSSLISSLILILIHILSVYNWHVLKIGNIVVLNHKYSAANLDDIIDFKWMKCTDLSFC